MLTKNDSFSKNALNKVALFENDNCPDYKLLWRSFQKERINCNSCNDCNRVLQMLQKIKESTLVDTNRKEISDSYRYKRQTTYSSLQMRSISFVDH